MKHKIILTIIVIALLAFWGIYFGWTAVIIAAVVIFVICFILEFRKKSTPIHTPKQEENLQNIINTYGDSDDIIIVNPVRANQSDGVIVVYDKKELLIICNIPVKKKDILDVTFNNAAMAYIETDYQIVFTINSESNPYLYIHVGHDASYAKEVLTQIKQHLEII